MIQAHMLGIWWFTESLCEMKVGGGLIRERGKVLLFYKATVSINRGQISFNVTKYLFTNA